MMPLSRSFSTLLKRVLRPDHPMVTGLVLLFGLLVSGLVWQLTAQQMRSYLQTEFGWVAQNRNRVFQKGIADAVDAITMVGHVVAGATMMDTSHFRALAEQQLARHPWLSSLTWHPASGSGVTVGPSEEDVLHNPAVLAGVALARETRQTTARLAAVGRSDDARNTFFVVLPVLASPPTATHPEAKAVAGFLVGRIDLAQLAGLSISILEPRGVEFLLLDETDPADPQFLDFYDSRLSSAPHSTVTASTWQAWRSQQTLLLTEQFSVADRLWSITCAATPYFRSAEGFAHAPLMVLLGGLLLTLTTVYFLEWIRRSLIERTRLYDELGKSETTLRVFFEQCPDIVLIVDRMSTIHAVNRDLPLLGHEAKRPLLTQGSCFLDVLPDDLLDVYQTVFKTVLLTGQPNQFSYQTGKSLWWEIRIAPIRRDNKLIEAMVLFTNVSERRFLELKALRNARLASMGTLAAGVAHEINNPNNAIHFNASILRRSWQDALPVLQAYHQTTDTFTLGGVAFGRASEAIPRLIDGITHSAERINGIVSSLKALTRNDDDKMSHRLDVQEIVHAALTLLDHQIKKHTDSLTTRVDASGAPDGVLLVWGNFQQLEQVVINLVMNALLALSDRSRSIQVVADCADEWVRIIVEDEGCGMDAKIQPFIFDPFFTTRTETGGTGLGLSLVQEIVNHHRGRIQVESKPGEGTKITVMLPLDGAPTGHPTQKIHDNSNGVETPLSEGCGHA
ncbi:MAG: PAS domain-containing protein [Magnetococcales bacterium]|nr:PAS domain-containing protein [Magnetococcales bacterium]